MSIGSTIADLRKQHGNMSQKALAEEVSINRSVLNRIEKGTRPARDEEIAAIANFFGVSTDYLMGRTDVPNPERLFDDFEPRTFPGVLRFSEVLRFSRLGKILAPEDVAEALNVSDRTVQQWEIGAAAPSMDKIPALADLLDIGADRLTKLVKEFSPAPPRTLSDSERAQAERNLELKSRIAEAREKAEKKQAELAVALNVSVETVQQWESLTWDNVFSLPTHTKCQQIAQLCGVNDLWLWDGRDFEKTENKRPQSVFTPLRYKKAEEEYKELFFGNKERWDIWELEKMLALAKAYSNLDEIDRAEIRGELNSLIKTALKSEKYAPQNNSAKG